MDKNDKKRFQEIDEKIKKTADIGKNMGMEMSFNPPVEKGVNRITDLATAAIFLLIIFGFTVLFYLTPDKEFSEAENRGLQGVPEMTLSNLISGKLTKEMSTYYSDQFPFRDTFVSVKTSVSYAFLRNENKGAVLGNDGYVLQRFDSYLARDGVFFSELMQNIKVNAEAVNTFAANLKESGITDVYCAVPPRKIDVMTNVLPYAFPTYRNMEYYEELYKTISRSLYVDLNAPLAAKNNEYIFYKTDHHWTSLGAYYAYCELIQRFGIEPIDKSEFTIETVSDEFYGTTWSKAGMKWVKPDVIELFRLPNEDEEYVTSAAGIDYNGFYKLDNLSVKDKYSTFTGGLSALKIISKKGETREKLLFIADSYGWALAPFLARHFDLEIIDMRDYSKSVYEFVIKNNITKVLILQNMESFAQTPTLRPLILK